MSAPSRRVNLGYSGNSNVISAQDSVNGNWTYTYDAMNRLVTSACAGNATAKCPDGTAAEGYNYLYDRFGNRWQQNLTAGSGPGPQPQYSFDANNHMIGQSYDAAGNVLNDGMHNYVYDAENRIIEVDSGSTAVYTYDAEGRRVRKVAGTTVDYVYDHAGHELAEVGTSGAWTREEVYVGGRHLATYSGTTTYFHNADWLGTERVRTDVNGNIYETCQGLPYGDGQACVGGEITPMHLTGKHRDTETNLDDFPARYYSSTQGRWLSPDPLMNSGEPTNPQTWNRYTYAENDPIGAFDPDGLFDWKGPACMAKQCEQYRKTLTDAVRTLKEKADKMKDSPEKRRLESALKAFGTAGDHNGVYVSFGPTRHGAAGETEPVFNAQTGRVDYNVTLDPHKMSGENEYAVNSAHEGTHVDDFSNPLYNDHATSLSAFAFEYRGYQTSVFAASALGASSLSAKYDGKNYELWNGSWAQVDRNLTNFISKFHDEGGNQNHPETTPHNPWPN